LILYQGDGAMKACKMKEIENKKYYCYFELALQVVGGKWKSIILNHLQCEKVLRFGQLKKAMPQITEKMLTQQLRELENDRIILRKVYKQVPPKVEYSLTEFGLKTIPVLEELRRFGIEYEAYFGLSGPYCDNPDFEQPER
jgi:DNA-binding HxlR family transcriptional regulator